MLMSDTSGLQIADFGPHDGGRKKNCINHGPHPPTQKSAKFQ